MVSNTNTTSVNSPTEIPRPLFYDGPSVSARLPPTTEGCRILSNEEAMSTLQANSVNTTVFSLYSSLHGGILTDTATMAIPFADHMVHRGHAVFDTATLLNGNIYQLEAHLDRFYRSIRLAQINHPFTSHEQVKDIIARTCAASGRKDGVLRWWLSSGGCDFAIHPKAGVPTFWVALMDGGAPLQGKLVPTKEVTIASSHVPMKPGLLAKAKTTNYFLNALCSIEATKRGGNFGIWLEESGRVAEASIASVVVVTKNGTVKVPHLDKILASITLQRAHDVTCEVLGLPTDDERRNVNHQRNGHRYPSSGNLLPSHIKAVERCHMTVHDLYDAQELFVVNGDCVLTPIIQLDSRTIGDGNIGPFTRWLHAEFLWEGRSGQRYCDPVPYHLYSNATHATSPHSLSKL